MREIVFDTETTGLDPNQGDRLVEIGCIELFNRFPTGNTFHRYLNPERDMPEGAFKVHGLSIEFLSDKPLFVHVVEELVEFLGDACGARIEQIQAFVERHAQFARHGFRGDFGALLEGDFDQRFECSMVRHGGTSCVYDRINGLG